MATMVPAGPDTRPTSTRRRRYERRGLLWRESALGRVRKCGRCSRVPGGSVGVRARPGQGVAGLSGLVTCGSVWACPVCSAKIAARRALEVGAAVATWHSKGKPVAMVTFTMRHRAEQPLGMLWDALGGAWHGVTSGKCWKAEKARHGLAGWLRVVEVTYGRHGWHVHVHALFFLDQEPAAVDLAAWHTAMVGRWSRALTRSGLSSPLMRGQDMRLVSPDDDAGTLGEYFAKAADQGGYGSIGRELTWSQGKQARTSLATVPPWAFLDAVEHDGDGDALTSWHEFERASKGRRQLTWSQGFRQELELGREATDEEVAGEVAGTEADELLRITADGWRVLIADPGRIADLLEVVESEGWVALRLFLDSLGVEYVMTSEGVTSGV